MSHFEMPGNYIPHDQIEQCLRDIDPNVEKTGSARWRFRPTSSARAICVSLEDYWLRLMGDFRQDKSICNSRWLESNHEFGPGSKIGIYTGNRAVTITEFSLSPSTPIKEQVQLAVQQFQTHRENCLAILPQSQTSLPSGDTGVCPHCSDIPWPETTSSRIISEMEELDWPAKLVGNRIEIEHIHRKNAGLFACMTCHADQSIRIHRPILNVQWTHSPVSMAATWHYLLRAACLLKSIRPAICLATGRQRLIWEAAFEGPLDTGLLESAFMAMDAATESVSNGINGLQNEGISSWYSRLSMAREEFLHPC